MSVKIVFITIVMLLFSVVVSLAGDIVKTGNLGFNVDKRVYVYSAYCTRVIDGDTAVMNLQLGFGISMSEPVRFLDYDAPETRRPASVTEIVLGKKAKKFLTKLIQGKELVVIVPALRMRGKYGRPLVYVYTLTGIDVIGEMKVHGFIKNKEVK